LGKVTFCDINRANFSLKTLSQAHNWYGGGVWRRGKRGKRGAGER